MPSREPFDPDERLRHHLGVANVDYKNAGPLEPYFERFTRPKLSPNNYYYASMYMLSLIFKKRYGYMYQHQEQAIWAIEMSDRDIPSSIRRGCVLHSIQFRECKWVVTLNRVKGCGRFEHKREIMMDTRIPQDRVRLFDYVNPSTSETRTVVGASLAVQSPAAAVAAPDLAGLGALHRPRRVAQRRAAKTRRRTKMNRNWTVDEVEEDGDENKENLPTEVGCQKDLSSTCAG